MRKDPKNWRKVSSEQSSYKRRNVIENENPSVSLQEVGSVDGTWAAILLCSGQSEPEASSGYRGDDALGGLSVLSSG